MLDLAFTLIFWRTAISTLLGVDLLPIVSVIFLVKLAYSSNKVKKYLTLWTILLLLLLTYSLILGYNALANINFLASSSLEVRLLYQFSSLSLFVIAYFLRSDNKTGTPSFPFTNASLWIFTLIIVLSQLSGGALYSDLFVSSNGGFRAFTSENGVLCNILLLLALSSTNTQGQGRLALIPLILVVAATRSSVALPTLLYIFLTHFLPNRKKEGRKVLNDLVLVTMLVALISIIMMQTLPDLLSKPQLLMTGGGKLDLGGRYVANSLIVSELLSNPSTLVYGKGLLSYQVLLQNFQLKSTSFNELFNLATFDYGGSDILLLFYETGISLPLAVMIIFFNRFKYLSSTSKFNVLQSIPFLLLLLLKGVGVFSPFILYVLYFILP